MVAFLYDTRHRVVQYVRDAPMALGRVTYATRDLANGLRMAVDADFAGGAVALARSTSVSGRARARLYLSDVPAVSVPPGIVAWCRVCGRSGGLFDLTTLLNS